MSKKLSAYMTEEYINKRAERGFREKILKSRGYRLAMLWVLAGNDQAKKFYESMGFNTDGSSKTLNIGKTFEANRYRKQLGAAEPSHSSGHGYRRAAEFVVIFL